MKTKEEIIHWANNSYEFSSPSSVAAVILGYSVNGRVIWKTESGKTLKELEEEIMKMPALE